MQRLRTIFYASLLTILAGGSAFALAIGSTERITEDMIAQVLEEALDQARIIPHSLTSLSEADILNIRLISQEKLSVSQWLAEVELEVDYGPAPAAVIGFERVRLGYYQLLLARQGDRLELLRFTPIAQTELLPTDG